ncbi:MAG: DUF3103 domain-containing protein [Prevotellaceae bacterium]|nr:DUF3103 domain-containing protein [Prevotellaceae bacterium]
MNKKIIYYLTFILIFISGCGKNEQPETAVTKPENNTPELINSKTLIAKEFAKLVASSVEDGDMRKFIKETSVKQFDGDYNFLFVQAENEQVTPLTKSGAGSTFCEKLKSQNGKIQTKSTSFTDFDLLIESIKKNYPLLQIAVPNTGGADENNSTENWNTQEYTPLVAFLHEDFNEATTEYITAYDVDGNEYQLDAKNPPANPVIVISENERVIAVPKTKAEKPKAVIYETESYSYFLRETSPSCGSSILSDLLNNILKALKTPQRKALAEDNPQIKRRDIILKAKFVDADALHEVESWAKGQPEVALTILFTYKEGGSIKSNTILKRFSDNGWYKGCGFLNLGKCVTVKELNVPIMYWDLTNNGNFMKYVFIEEDGGSNTSYKISYNNVYEETTVNGQKTTTTTNASIDIPKENNDDIIGEAIVNFADPVLNGGTRYSTGLLEFWIGIE